MGFALTIFGCLAWALGIGSLELAEPLNTALCAAGGFVFGVLGRAIDDGVL